MDGSNGDTLNSLEWVVRLHIKRILVDPNRCPYRKRCKWYASHCQISNILLHTCISSMLDMHIHLIKP
ncbi:hypothetical protein SKUD_188903 [Saccharomyces kudriavzevii IFO 1802]|uniref:Uncharacterized protein n=1 Tax=Saccharomyces kudriavzevii (strain ATCC MYA-4449 / AS 2.2408 / CBS 8840 / NBRC 1802 / NCYC 2889) TaxID=226230 RepID=J5P9C6_SACK1|nr:hypothetical protein SKUD_188903 [Saccharomyces kudriavzevii IFO 1802]